MKYEIMFIVRPDLEEEAIKGNAKEVEKIFTDNNAKILSSKNTGQKNLAYEIQKHKSGYYFLYEIDAKDKKVIDEFNRFVLLSEDIIRHIVIKLED